jgi:hypothetical protein
VSERKVVGHKTFRADDGNGFRHEPLYEDEADEILARCEAAEKRRNELMPDEQAAIELFFDAWLRLKDFGWNEAIYCPKDRSKFQVIECGSTGKHPCIYEGEWPTGTWWIVSDGDMCPSRPALWKPLEEQSK